MSRFASAISLPTFSQPNDAGKLAAHEDVADDRLLHGERPVLKHRLDAGLARPRGAPSRYRLAADEDFAAGRLHDAGEDLDQRRLAGAVVADEADHLAVIDAEIDAAERIDAAVGFGDVAQLDQAFRHGSLLDCACRPGHPGRPMAADQRSACLASSATIS